jgi:2-C-methyl-D-erythritol 4-phosphate cytidylyltransferase
MAIGSEKGNVLALILSAGSSTRMEGADKVFVSLAGKPVILHSVELFADFFEIREILFVAAAGSIDRLNEIVEPASGGKLAGIVAGGDRRQDSARVGLTALRDRGYGDNVVLIHDAARPLADQALVRRVLDAFPGADGVVPVVTVDDTIKRVDASGAVEATLNREFMRAVQTPQGFKLDYILNLHGRAAADGYYATDDAALAEHYGGRVVTVDGDVGNIKITRPVDLKIAEVLLASKER